jgi:hypothetical protein
MRLSVCERRVRKLGVRGGDGPTDQYQLVDGTAFEGQEYRSSAGEVHFSKGDRHRRFYIWMTNNKHPERDETFEVILDGDFIVVNGDNSITVTIDGLD